MHLANGDIKEGEFQNNIFYGSAPTTATPDKQLKKSQSHQILAKKLQKPPS